MIHQHRVRYHETDAQGFLFNSRYLEIADVAMTEFFRDLGWTYGQLNDAGLDPSVVAVQLTFRRPVRFDELVLVEVGCTRVGRSSFTLTMAYSIDVNSVAHAEITYVNVDPTTARAAALPEDVMRRMISVRTTHNESREVP